MNIKDFDRGFGLELIQGILISSYKLFREEKVLLDVLKQKICSLIIKCYSEKLEYSETVRLTRLSVAIIKYFHEYLVILKIILTIFSL